ncbi:carbohydrate binding domain-containing protein, partial [Candidatus Gottesmanbacteria bacterium]|nr:carbohydrate binding domain-containing protein [Candidatus Gottesmanbacteria bacterium]
MKKIVLISALIFSFSVRDVLASNIPGVQTPIAINPQGSGNMIGNGDFESGNADGWQFGDLNRAIINWGAKSGNYWLDTNNCSGCPSGFGDGKTLAYDVNENITVGQKYTASVYFRSPQGGTVEFVVWAIGGTREAFSTFDKVGTGDWQKLEISNFEIKNPGHNLLRVQIYIKNVANGIQYQFDNFILSQAGISGSCPTSYYAYQQPLKLESPTLDDLFSGKAHLQSPGEAQRVNLDFNPAHVSIADGDYSKLPILYNPEDRKYYAYSRSLGIDRRYKMFLMISTDGLNFTEVAPIFDDSVINEVGQVYDGHIAIDYSVCPTRYMMALETSGQMSVSYTTTPFIPSSWSKPKVIVHMILDYQRNILKSASTGTFLIDGNQKYAAWTVVDGHPPDRNGNPQPDNGNEATYSQGVGASDLLTDLGDSSIGNVLLPAEKNTHCTSSWDCNNKDKQDWKKEGNYYYLIYNGANYFGCVRPLNDQQYTNDWGNSIVRSTNPLGGYSLPGLGKIINSEDKVICGTSYPMINNVNGELYMYYAYRRSIGGNMPLRSKLVWNSSSPLPGDL